MKKLTQLKSHLLFAVLFSVTIASCKKDTTQTAKNIQGLWVGTIGNSSSSGVPYSLAIKSDGKITFEGYAGNVYHFGVGTWTLSANTFTANVTTMYGISSNVGVQQRLTATFNPSNGTLTNGTYVNVNPANDNGTFAVTKVY
ncbi:hypothetical protein IQ13_3975 [Lacibacter cauensis]|uniref:Lipocalin-like protein n=1 Tax=Lacibacter cauensis TaxID=510947 RepID=A0A562SAU3_9BACT|nr:hypothetical protein [Lacibacter cauensis]TWI78293.1 hypothetical protein IQ13_3975 [Lacibacter cauensis]